MWRFVWVILVILTGLLAACGGGDLPAPAALPATPQTVLPVATDAVMVTEMASLPVVTLDVVLAVLPLDCGAEASIGFAQAQNDLALAAEAQVSGLDSTNMPMLAAVGQAAFGTALAQLQTYTIPACLEPARQAAVASLQARVAGYVALGAGDDETRQAQFTQSELYRQQAVTVLNEILAGQ